MKVLNITAGINGINSEILFAIIYDLCGGLNKEKLMMNFIVKNYQLSLKKIYT